MKEHPFPHAACIRAAAFACVLTCALVLAPGPEPALADEGCASAFELTRPVIDDPEVGQPGDDDQPTVTNRKRDRRVAIPSGGAGGSTGGTKAVEPPARRWGSRWIEGVRAFVGRLRTVLQSPS
jgi:hypothetical protein